MVTDREIKKLARFNAKLKSKKNTKKSMSHSDLKKAYQKAKADKDYKRDMSRNKRLYSKGLISKREYLKEGNLLNKLLYMKRGRRR